MKTPHSTHYKYSSETINAANRLGVGTVDEHAHKSGMLAGEPLTVAMDCLLKYAQAYKERYESGLADDHVLGPLWLDSMKGLRGLLNGDGSEAMRLDITTDSKSNVALESVFWTAMAVAGYSDTDI